MARPVDIRARECRELFQRAIRDNVTMAEARQRIASERWGETETRLAIKRAAPSHGLNEERAARFWWQRD